MENTQNTVCNSAGGDGAKRVTELPLNTEMAVPAQMHPNQTTEVPEICPRLAGGDNSQIQSEKNDKASIDATPSCNGNATNEVVKLKAAFEACLAERDAFRKKLEEAESKLSALHQATNKQNDSGDLNFELDKLKLNLENTKIALEDRERRVANQESQISALTKQVSSLKEVVAITKDMLNIRNTEMKNLQENVDKMETKISEERERHNSMLNKMNTAVQLNADLKKEYQTQLRLFQDLRGKYEEKVELLSEENKALETAVQAQPAQ
ncbi:CAP-Gly domain-containing linker protein 1 [Trichogramma pretiosum]|uniref:CAP-Gly domain-containing linker protein 1 n=1 Tax=Trichogramma pretiosum TaxID=7493 RepID=UPI0006C9D643|nr:CAP-Gly domain-containing linker protein 1 [Trichogramma pretiosum]XP_014222113.1 CAP-Gly domain-containing linker protein 1 [Trichogramma pretiosum]